MNINNNVYQGQDVEKEIIILTEIQELSQNMAMLIQNFQKEKTIIIKNIIALDNNYFTKNSIILEKLNCNIFDKLLNNTIELTDCVNEYLLNSCCNHEYIDDLIDIDVDRSLKITYCQICEVTKMS
jgi:hypothetical protein